MASLTAQVNRRLASTRVLLAELATSSERTPFAEQAILEAGLFHLCCGYTHYLRELCGYYGVSSIAAIDTEVDVRQALERLGKQPAEVTELCQLAQRPDAWLSQLLSSYRACWASDANSEHLIQVQRLDDTPLVDLSRAHLTQWLDELQATIERHRQSSTEC